MMSGQQRSKCSSTKNQDGKCVSRYHGEKGKNSHTHTQQAELKKHKLSQLQVDRQASRRPMAHARPPSFVSNKSIEEDTIDYNAKGAILSHRRLNYSLNVLLM
jgi:hypothetical protein